MEREKRPLVLTRSGIVGTIAVLVVAVVCVRLGLWQLDRRGERLAQNRVVAERLEAEPVALSTLPVDTAGLGYRRATVTGVPDGARSVVLAGRSYAGQPGVHVYTPVQLGGGAVLVNRGWLPSADAATVELPPTPIGREVTWEGVLMPFPDVDLDRPAPATFRRTWFRLDQENIRGQLPYPTPPLYLQAVDLDDGGAGRVEGSGAYADGSTGTAGAAAGAAGGTGQPVRLAGPSLDAGPHLSYAIQWFSFAAVFLVGWAALLLTRGSRGAGSGTTVGARRYPETKS